MSQWNRTRPRSLRVLKLLAAATVAILLGAVGRSRDLAAADSLFYAPDQNILFGMNFLAPPRWQSDAGDSAHQQHMDAAAQALTHGLHFSHPLVTETPTPDSKLRVDYFHTRINESGTKARIHTLHAELEVDWRNLFSLSISVPYVFTEVEHAPRQSHFDNIEIAFKMANYALSEYGIVYGGGIEVELPSGNDAKDIGSDHLVSYAPFLDVGYEYDKLQAILFVTFEMPTHQQPGEEVENEMAVDLALLYHATAWFWGVAELNTGIPLTGGETGHVVVNLTPGIKVQPLSEYDLVFGFGVTLPVGENREFEYQLIFSTFWHF